MFFVDAIGVSTKTKGCKMKIANVTVNANGDEFLKFETDFNGVAAILRHAATKEIEAGDGESFAMNITWEFVDGEPSEAFETAADLSESLDANW